MTVAPRTWGAGETVTAALMNQEIRDQLNSFFGAWTPYTPAWTASTTNPVLGNGTITGRYMKLGRIVFCNINLTTGSTTTYGSGDYGFSLPATAAAAGIAVVGQAHLLGVSRWAGQMVISSGASTTAPFFSDSATNPRLTWMSPTKPETHAAGAQLRVSFTYESAT